MRLYPLKPLLSLLDVAVDAEVCCLALHVLGIANATNGCVKFQRSKSAANLDGLLHGGAEWLQYVMHQRTEVYYVRLPWVIADALRLGGVARAKFLQCKVLADLCGHILINI